MKTILTLPATVDCSALSYLDAKETILAIEEARAECDFTLEIIRTFIKRLKEECKNDPQEWADIKKDVLKSLD